MADYIEDNGGDNYDALLSGTYITDAANCTLTLGSDGEGDTGYVLPSDSSWVLVEIYDVEDVYGDLGLHKFNSDTTSVATYIEAVRTSGIAEYTTFKITSTHYKGDGTADIYYGDESTATAVHNADISYTPPVTNWIIQLDLTTPLNELLICDESYDCNVTWLC